MQHPPNHIFELAPARLRELVTAAGMRGFSAEQILRWVYERTVGEPALMSNLSKLDRERLREVLVFTSGAIVQTERASDGTRKLLLRWQEDAGVGAGEVPGSVREIELPQAVTERTTELETECVLIPAGGGGGGGGGRGRGAGVVDAKVRRTACVSSQVGCPVGCSFCASGLGGLAGNLSAGRIVEQVWRLNQLLAEEAAVNGSAAGRITNVVFMGMGEPLANYAAVIEAVRILNAPWGFNLSARRITISTVGMPAGIRRLARERLPVTLALSLHAPNDELRRELIPWAEYAGIEELLAACREYFSLTGREITFEYTIMQGVNDQPEHARQLARLVRTVRGKVNLIRYNEVAGLPYGRPLSEVVHEFQRILRSKKVNVQIRASRGRDISAACGQLRQEARRG